MADKIVLLYDFILQDNVESFKALHSLSTVRRGVSCKSVCVNVGLGSEIQHLYP